MRDGGEGPLWLGSGEAILGRGVSCAYLWGNVGWVLSSLVLCSHPLPQMWAVSHRSRVEGKARFMARVGRKRVKAYQEPVVWATE